MQLQIIWYGMGWAHAQLSALGCCTDSMQGPNSLQLDTPAGVCLAGTKMQQLAISWVMFDNPVLNRHRHQWRSLPLPVPGTRGLLIWLLTYAVHAHQCIKSLVIKTLRSASN